MRFGCEDSCLEILFSFSLTLCEALSFSVGFWLLPQNLDFRSAHCPASTVHTSGFLQTWFFFFKLWRKKCNQKLSQANIDPLAHWPASTHLIWIKFVLKFAFTVHTSGLYKHVCFLNLKKLRQSIFCSASTLHRWINQGHRIVRTLF